MSLLAFRIVYGPIPYLGMFLIKPAGNEWTGKHAEQNGTIYNAHFCFPPVLLLYAPKSMEILLCQNCVCQNYSINIRNVQISEAVFILFPIPHISGNP
jgi:hypothetical protein